MPQLWAMAQEIQEKEQQHINGTENIEILLKSNATEGFWIYN